MIGMLRGKIWQVHPPMVMLDVGGIGYEVEVPLSLCQQVPETGELWAVWTHTAMRDDGIYLYGFSSARQRMRFRQFLRISGVGAKMALNLLSHFDEAQLVSVLQSGDIASLTRIPGIGKRTAQRLVVELQESMASSAVPEHRSPGTDDNVRQEAHLALLSLGYQRSEVNDLFERITWSPDDSTESIVRRALQHVAQRMTIKPD